MPSIKLNTISFQYESSSEPVFENLSLSIDTQWKTGLIGRNGRGKSTLLQLFNGTFLPRRGNIESPCPTALFPFEIMDAHLPVFDVIKQSIAPFTQWEKEMETFLSRGDDQSMLQYGEIHDLYLKNNGYEIDPLIAKESQLIGLTAEMLARSFSTLSGGEQTRAMIAALFLKHNIFPLLDEPTNHLDMKGRELLGDYLSKKKGFVIVSHDRYFLDLCCDHIVALNKNDVRVVQGNYTTWNNQMSLEEETERARNENLAKEIASLETAAQQRRSWSFTREKEKHKAMDSGFVSRRAAKMMKRALALEQRIEKNIEEKKSLLRNRETVRLLKMDEAEHSPDMLISVENATIEINGKILVKNFSMNVRKGERVALLGNNGSGKTTLMRIIRGKMPLVSGNCYVPKFISIANGYQHSLWQTGMLKDHLTASGVDETRFRTIMGSFNIQGEIFDRPLETFSQGELKKVDLCRSFMKPHHLLVWDEPVNYIDIYSKEQIESVLLKDEPTMLFTEHDRAFVDKIATRVIDLSPETIK